MEYMFSMNSLLTFHRCFTSVIFVSYKLNVFIDLNCGWLSCVWQNLINMTMQEIDTSNGIIFPFYDQDTSMIYLCGKVRHKVYFLCLRCVIIDA